MNRQDRIWLTLLATSFLAVSPIASPYILDLLGTALVFGLFAASVDLLWGYCGVLNLGAALYFGIGAYFSAYFLTNDMGFGPGLIAGVTFAITSAYLIGLIGLRRSESSVQFGLIGLAISLAAEQIMIRLYGLAGGSNGITNVVTPALLISRDGVANQRAYYILVCLVVFGTIALLIRIANSHSGRILLGARHTLQRMEAIGYDPCTVKNFANMVTASVSAIAGGLYAPLSGVAHPGLFGAAPNLLVLIWVAIGGEGSIRGPFICAVALKIIESELGSEYSNIYMLLIGVVFICTVLWRPLGVFGRP